MIASEPLTFEERDWMVVKTNTMIVVTQQVRYVLLEFRQSFLTQEINTKDEPFANSHHGELDAQGHHLSWSGADPDADRFAFRTSTTYLPKTTPIDPATSCAQRD